MTNALKALFSGVAPTASSPLPSQRRAFEELLRYADLFFSNDWKNLPLRPRIYPLLVGPSGVGKTWLVSHLARELSIGDAMPVMHLHFGEWIPCGARVLKGHTLSTLHDFVINNRQGIIHLDELDKFRLQSSDWSISIQQEIFAMLDYRMHAAHDKAWTRGLCDYFRLNFFVVGSGTWQDLWDSPQPLGFQTGSEASGSMLKSIGDQRSIPVELMRRFSAQPILIPYLTADDVAAILDQLATAIDPDLLAGLRGKEKEVAESRKGIRAFEEHVTQRLMEIRSKQKKDEITF